MRESRSPLPRLAGVSTVMRTLPPQPPEGHHHADAVVAESAWRLHALREVQFAFQSPREVPLWFFAPHAVSIKSNSSPSRTMRPLTGRPRHQNDWALRYASNTIGNLVKSDPSTTNFVDCRILTTRLPEWANGLQTAMTDGHVDQKLLITFNIKIIGGCGITLF